MTAGRFQCYNALSDPELKTLSGMPERKT